MPKILVFGNEKGGTGKSTMAMHVSIFFLRKGFRVGTIDIDARQGTLSRYLENRYLKKKNNPDMDLPTPKNIRLVKSELDSVLQNKEDEEQKFENAIDDLSNNDIIVVDTPGSDQNLSRIAHSYADVLITPINDSFIDLDLLIHLDQEMKGLKPSIYAEMVWDQRKERAKKARKSIDWIVLRNRIIATTSNNYREMDAILRSLSKRIGFHYLEGFSERVIFKELFPSGMTLLDLKENRLAFSHSHLCARRELISLVEYIERLICRNILSSAL